MDTTDKTKATEALACSTVNKVDWALIDSGNKSDIADYIFGLAWDCFESGWEKSKEANDAATFFLENELYRKGVVAEFDGMEFTHGGSTYLKLKFADGLTTEFSLKNLPDYDSLQEFSMLSVHLSSDEYVAALADQNVELAKSLKLISGVVEKVYWRKVAASLKSYHEESMVKIKARSILLASGIGADDVDGLIPEPAVWHD